MNNKTMVIVLVVALLLIGGVVWFSTKQSGNSQTLSKDDVAADVGTETNSFTKSPEANAPADQLTPETPTPAEEEITGTLTTGEDIDAPDISVFEVSYNGQTFSPASITIKAGDIIFFKNESSKSFRPASDPHPTHIKYPEFDADDAIAAGKTFQFKFTKIGTWGYHDHLNPGATATVVVTK